MGSLLPRSSWRKSILLAHTPPFAAEFDTDIEDNRTNSEIQSVVVA